MVDWDKSDSPEYLITEYFGSKNLQKINFKNHCIDSENIPQLFFQIFGGLDYLHNMNIVHCDLKPENIFLRMDNGHMEAKIGDLGNASTPSKTALHNTTPFLSPKTRNAQPVNFKRDIWAIDIIIMLCLGTLNQLQLVWFNIPELKTKNSNARKVFKKWTKIVIDSAQNLPETQKMRALIVGLVQKKLKLRLTAKGAKDILYSLMSEEEKEMMGISGCKTTKRQVLQPSHFTSTL